MKHTRRPWFIFGLLSVLVNCNLYLREPHKTAFVEEPPRFF
ncbi:hypothetical protein HanRHA438_Chr01g0021531 [Helianthus annuus]|nr:hypothetical protein HanRHA438_Chr01g0021531 [Helianthus annuus]